MPTIAEREKNTRYKDFRNARDSARHALVSIDESSFPRRTGKLSTSARNQVPVRSSSEGCDSTSVILSRALVFQHGVSCVHIAPARRPTHDRQLTLEVSIHPETCLLFHRLASLIFPLVCLPPTICAPTCSRSLPISSCTSSCHFPGRPSHSPP